MFGLFKSRLSGPKISPENKIWIEESILWYVKVYGLKRLTQRAFIQQGEIKGLDSDLRHPPNFRKLFEQICRIWDVKAETVRVNIFDDIDSMRWDNLAPIGPSNEPAGLYYQEFTTDPQRFHIRLASSNLDKPEFLVYVLAHELAHVKLLGEGLINSNDVNMEPLTDLAVIFFGFGIFYANNHVIEANDKISRGGYLPSDLIAYANACLCYISKNDGKEIAGYLNRNTKELFETDYNFLVSSDDTLLTESEVKAANEFYVWNDQITQGFKNREFDKVIAASMLLMEVDPNNSVIRHNLAYALLQQKKYQQAIIEFTKVANMNPYEPYVFNNRGYCSLQLGDLENALIDLESSFHLEPENSFSWRNLGAYYLAIGDNGKALEYFEHAQKMDPGTEMINFYLSYAHNKLGSTERAAEFAHLSKLANEYNDSLLEL